jgi:hypothetical protein
MASHIISTLSIIAALGAYEYDRVTSAQQRWEAKKYRVVSCINALDAKKRLFISEGYDKSNEPWKCQCHEFDEAVIMSMNDDDMKKCYDREIIMKHVPSFLK